MSLKVKDVFWVSNRFGTIGMALCENAEGKRSIRISSVTGINEEEDTGMIADWGGKIPRAVVAQMILHFSEDPEENE